jgi:transposase InsO family protein
MATGLDRHGRGTMYQNQRYRYVLTVVDVFSKHAWARPLRTKEAERVTAALEDIILENGKAPRIMQSDNGGEFRNGWMSELCDRYEMQQVFGAPYRPQSQGAIERFNQTLKRALYSHMTSYNTQTWVRVLPLALENYNHTYHQSIGTAPAVLHQTQNEIEIK